MVQGMLSGLHLTQEGWEGGTVAKDPYPHKQERPVSQLGHGHLVDKGQGRPRAVSGVRLLALPLPAWVTLGKGLHLADPLFPHL